ncbi:MAG: hypothetical protein IPK26_05995 [Planctomycetes bacterium]|nr:hypothetical protein [Planctomycetota bacterium]
MRLSLTVSFPLLSLALLGQAPADEHAPAMPQLPSGAPEGAIDCSEIANPFDVTNTCGTGDVRILGVANVNSNLTNVRKWFFSGSNGGTTPQTNQQIYVYDADAANYPVAASVRGVLHHPSMVSPLWGHRDGEGYTYVDTTNSQFKSIAMFGDEADQIMWLDAASETWLGQTTLTGFAGAVVRALAIQPTNPAINTEVVKVYVSDFSSGIAVWDVNLALNTAAPDTSNPALTSPPGTYGASCFQHNNLWYLAVHHQSANTCVGTGLVKVSVIDINPGASYGSIVWTRTLDDSVPGPAPNINGGIAGGLQHCVVNGQPCFAGLQQATADTCGFVPYTIVSGRPGPADCGAEQLTLNTDGSSLGLQVNGAAPGGLYVVALNFPPAAGIPLPFNPACTLDTALPVLATFLLIGTNQTIPAPVPPGFVLDLVADAGRLATPITSTNRVDIQICPAPF